MNDRRKEFMEHIRNLKEKEENGEIVIDTANLFMAYKVDAECQRREDEAAEAQGRDK